MTLLPLPIIRLAASRRTTTATSSIALAYNLATRRMSSYSAFPHAAPERVAELKENVDAINDEITQASQSVKRSANVCFILAPFTPIRLC